MNEGWVSAHEFLKAHREAEIEDRRTRRDPDSDAPWLELITGRPSTDSSWTAEAACKGRDTDRWFSDDISQPADTEPILPETAMLAMRVCYRCPVRARCLEEAFELTQPMSFGNLRVYTKHTRACDDALYGRLGITEQAKAKACEACVPEEERLREQTEGFTLKPMHQGIFGGIQAYIRKRLESLPDRTELAEVWLQQVASRRRWGSLKDEESSAMTPTEGASA